MDIKGVALKKELEILQKESDFYAKRLFHYRSDFVFSFLSADYYDIQKVINQYNAMVGTFNEYAEQQKLNISLQGIEREIKDTTPIPEVCSDMKEIHRRTSVVIVALHAKTNGEERQQKIEKLKLELAKAEDSSLKQLAQEILELT